MTISAEDRELATEGVAALGALCDELRSDFEGLGEDFDMTLAEVVSDYAKVFGRVLPEASPMHKTIALLSKMELEDVDFSHDVNNGDPSPDKPPITVRAAVRNISMLQGAVASRLGIPMPHRSALLRRRRLIVSESVRPETD